MVVTFKTCAICCIAGLFVLTTFWALPGNGTIGHAIDVAHLVEASDLVVIGLVTSIGEPQIKGSSLRNSLTSENSLVATLAVDAQLKGNLDETKIVFIEFPKPGAPNGIFTLLPGQYGIFFLQRGKSAFRVSDPFYPFLPAEPGGKALSGPPLEQVAAKLGEILTDARSTEFGISSALDALRLIQGRFATEILHQALNESSGQLRLRIASRLVARGDITALDLVETALRQPRALPANLQADLAGSLAGLKDPRSIPALKRLLKTKDQQITWAIAIALRQIGSSDALEPLSELLGNSNEEIRYHAVVGMGKITSQDDWTPAFDEFREHEAKYLSYWRNWAESNLPRNAGK